MAVILAHAHRRRIIGYKALLSMPPTDKKSKEPTYALVMEYAQVRQCQCDADKVIRSDMTVWRYTRISAPDQSLGHCN